MGWAIRFGMVNTLDRTGFDGQRAGPVGTTGARGAQAGQAHPSLVWMRWLGEYGQGAGRMPLPMS
ncbi:hypothetical protein C0V97_02000 [Asaia sp. W19]|nr:hypothetical protein C0V97_02000 [Asaia sp. W19]